MVQRGTEVMQSIVQHDAYDRLRDEEFDNNWVGDPRRSADRDRPLGE